MAAGSYIRKSFKGGAPATVLSGGITNSATSLVIANATGWPDGATAPFVIVIGRGTPNEEKCLVASRTGTTLTITTRGYDDTTGIAHASGVAVEHGLDASTIDQANRLANLMTAKGQVIGHNGTNPTAVTAALTDGFQLEVDNAQGTGLKFTRPVHVILDASAPSVAGIQRMWLDDTTGLFRVSDGATWIIPGLVPRVANTAARDSLFGSPPTYNAACLVGSSGSTQLQVWDGTIWQRYARLDESIPKFANTTARDAYYTAPATGDHAYITGTHQLLEYREDEWILINQKITTSESAPASPHEGDIWLQPTS